MEGRSSLLQSPAITGGRGPKFAELFIVICLLINGYVAAVPADVTPDPARSCDPEGTKQSDEQRLHKCLLDNLDPTVRPARSASDTVNVTMDTLVLRLLDMDEKSHIMTTAGWVHHIWHDFQLTWNPEDYGGLQQVRIPIDRIWTPDIVLFNNADDSFRYVYDKLALISRDGTVTWVPHARLRSYCTLDLSRFPFDTQSCSLIFGSWTHDVKAVNITHRERVKPQYIMDGNEWTIKSVTTDRYEWTHGIEESYAGIVTKMTMRRTSSFYQYAFVMPTVMFAIMVLLVPFINPKSSERLIFCVALILGCVMILMMLEQQMPTEIGTVPVVAAYLAYLMVMITINMMFSILVSNMHQRDPKQGKVPGWVRWTFLTKLNKLVCLQVDPYTTISLEVNEDENALERELFDIRNGTAEFQTMDAKSQLQRTLDDIRRYLRVSTARAAGGAPVSTHQDLVVQEWVQVARVIDRLVFATFLLLTIVITISMYSHY